MTKYVKKARESKEMINTFATTGMIKEWGWLKKGDEIIGWGVYFKTPIRLDDIFDNEDI